VPLGAVDFGHEKPDENKVNAIIFLYAHSAKQYGLSNVLLDLKSEV
jgi:hypothetical protein